MNPKLIQFLEKLQEAAQGGAVQPQELIKISDAILAIVKDNRETLSKSISDLSESVDSEITDLKSLIISKENRLIDSLQENTKEQSKEIEKKYKKLSSEIKKLINLIPEETDLSEIEAKIESVRKEIPKIPEFKDVVLDNGYEIIKKINETPVNADTMIDAERIKNLPKSTRGVGGSKSLKGLILDVLIESEPTNGQVLKWSSALKRWVPGTDNNSGGGGGGVTVETPTESVDSSNVSFTVTAEPKWVVVDGITYFDGAGYTYSALTVTMDTPPTMFIRAII